MPTDFSNSTVRKSIEPALAMLSISLRACRSSTTYGTPASCSRWAAIRPAGPAPTIATVVSGWSAADAPTAAKSSRARPQVNYC